MPGRFFFLLPFLCDLMEILLVEKHIRFLLPEDHGQPDSNHLIKLVESSLNGTLDELNNRKASSERDKKRLEEVAQFLSDAKKYPLLHSVYRNYTDLVPVKPCEFWSGEPPYTNYTTWKGTLDYIFIFPIKKEVEEAKSLELIGVLEIPPEELLSKQTALPSDIFPSDHISIGCLLQLNC